MSRDHDHYAYYTVGIAKESPTHKALLADASQRGCKQIPALIGIRLGDYYQLIQGGQVIQMAITPVENKDGTNYSEMALSNAAAADDAWPDD